METHDGIPKRNSLHWEGWGTSTPAPVAEQLGISSVGGPGWWTANGEGMELLA